MAEGQTSFENDFERKFWADACVAYIRCHGQLANYAATGADKALDELRKRTPTQLTLAIGKDELDAAMAQVETLGGTAGPPPDDPDIVAARSRIAAALDTIERKTKSALVKPADFHVVPEPEQQRVPWDIDERRKLACQTYKLYQSEINFGVDASEDFYERAIRDTTPGYINPNNKRLLDEIAVVLGPRVMHHFTVGVEFDNKIRGRDVSEREFFVGLVRKLCTVTRALDSVNRPERYRPEAEGVGVPWAGPCGVAK